MIHSSVERRLLHETFVYGHIKREYNHFGLTALERSIREIDMFLHTNYFADRWGHNQRSLTYSPHLQTASLPTKTFIRLI